jgi:hypothetical protein
VHVVELEFVPAPDTLQTGEPPCLKCGLAASAAVALKANSVTARTSARLTFLIAPLESLVLRIRGSPGVRW